MIRLRFKFLIVVATVAFSVSGDARSDDHEAVFKNEVLPTLEKYCFDCHEPGLSEGDVEFLEGDSVAEMQSMRGVWRSVGSQLKNRTMPPVEEELQPTAEERKRISDWIENHLQKTAFDQKPYAGKVMPRRLNRFEYNNTIRDLVGVDLRFSETLPADGGAGVGFDNNGESLFLQPMLMERYIEAARRIVDAAVISPPLKEAVKSEAMLPTTEAKIRVLDFSKRAANEATALVSVHEDANYFLTARIEKPPKGDVGRRRLVLKVDGLPAHRFAFDSEGDKQTGKGRFLEKRVKLRLSRGAHAFTFAAAKDSKSIHFHEMWISQEEREITKQDAEVHRNLLGVDPGHAVKEPRKQATETLSSFLKLAFRRQVKKGEVERFLTLYDRAEKRGDPWEERMKLVFSGVLVSPHFLYLMESEPQKEGIQPLSDHELAARLSYYLWSTMPDAELTELADQGLLRNPDIYNEQIDRLLDDSRSRAFAKNFVGQWLGTKDVGSRVAPITNELQETYTVDLASDMREEAVELFHHIVTENRPVTEMIDADYTFVTRRLGEHYQLKNWKELPKERFQRVSVGGQRGGVLGMAAVLALTSHYKKTSPILRGAWVFDTLIGDPVPPPPANVPELREKSNDGKRKLTDREKIELHRERASCMACHKLIDPIGFALQNYDFLGKWRDRDQKQPIDATGVLPTGEKFTGLGELKAVLIKTRKTEFLRHLSRKMLGYALGRSLNEKDDGTVERMVVELMKDDFNGRDFIHALATSVPFQNHELEE